MGKFGTFQSDEGEYFEYRRASKFISEILIAISSVVTIGSIGTLIGLVLQLKAPDDSANATTTKDITFALIIYTIVILIVSVSDVIFALILHTGIRKLKLSYCLFWRGATLTSLIVAGMLTLAFVTMVHDLLLLLGYIPSIVSKPFSLWMVNGFIRELGELRTFPYHISTAVPPARPTFSLDDPDALKRTTTVFQLKRKLGGNYQNPYIITSKLRSIPE